MIDNDAILTPINDAILTPTHWTIGTESMPRTVVVPGKPVPALGPCPGADGLTCFAGMLYPWPPSADAYECPECKPMWDPRSWSKAAVVTLRPEKRAPTAAEIHLAHVRKAARYGTEEAATQACRDAEARKGWPANAMSAYLCVVCKQFHIGRTRAFIAYQRRDARPRHDILLHEVLGERVMAHAKLENRGPLRARRAHIRRFGGTIKRIQKRTALAQ